MFQISTRWYQEFFHVVWVWIYWIYFNFFWIPNEILKSVMLNVLIMWGWGFIFMGAVRLLTLWVVLERKPITCVSSSCLHWCFRFKCNWMWFVCGLMVRMEILNSSGWFWKWCVAMAFRMVFGIWFLPKLATDVFCSFCLIKSCKSQLIHDLEFLNFGIALLGDLFGSFCA